MNTLCIDRGNSRVKAGIFDNSGKLLDKQSFLPEQALEGVGQLAEQHKPHATIYCGVAGDTVEIKELLDSYGPFLVLDGNTKVPIINAYQTTDTLGADRIALAVAAQHQHPDKHNLVIAIGTCITYNFITNQRTFRGGAISPGYHMRLRAMHEFTARLPEVKEVGDVQLLGYDTESCMRSGAFYGMAAEVHGMIQAFAAQYGDFNAFLTGGDAPAVARQLKMEIFADPDLILKGLYLILRHNVKNI